MLRNTNFLNKTSRLILVFLLGGTLKSISQNNPTEFIHEWNQLLTEQMIKDGFNPLLASRTFAYCNLSLYQAFSTSPGNTIQLTNELNGFNFPKKKVHSTDINYEIAAIGAFYKTALKHIYREYAADSLIKRQLNNFRKLGIKESTIKNSLKLGDSIALVSNNRAANDGFAKSKALPNYIFSNQPGKWKPTPPEFRSALEPHWDILQPFLIDSASQFSQGFAIPNSTEKRFGIPYSSEKGSDFYAMVNYVYHTSINLYPEQKNIALYWDDNPDLNNFVGHIPKPRRHINPVSHWICIIAQFCSHEKYSFEKTSLVYALCSMAMADAVISVWHDKYKTELVRPVTYIREFIDPDWMPLIVTPPFPEFTSGHSGISAAAAQILTAFAGPNYSFTDSTFTIIGLPYKPRSFSSFLQAAEEAGISRLYGGIHYQNGIQAGNYQGKLIGKFILNKLGIPLNTKEE